MKGARSRRSVSTIWSCQQIGGVKNKRTEVPVYLIEEGFFFDLQIELFKTLKYGIVRPIKTWSSKDILKTLGLFICEDGYIYWGRISKST